MSLFYFFRQGGIHEQNDGARSFLRGEFRSDLRNVDRGSHRLQGGRHLQGRRGSAGQNAQRVRRKGLKST